VSSTSNYDTELTDFINKFDNDVYIFVT